MEATPGPGVRVVPPGALPLGLVEAPQPDVQRRQALLSIEDQGELLDASGAGELVVGTALARALEELVCVPLVAVLGVQFPEEEGAYGVAAHQGVEERAYLVRRPHELPLDGREKVVAVEALEGVTVPKWENCTLRLAV